MARRGAPIQVEGYREFQRAVSKAADRGIPKAVGQAHKEAGRLVISRLRPRPQPEAVGAGAGATVRPSATRREVILRVGGAHREDPPRSVWGKRRVVRPGVPVPERPHIIGTALDNQDDVEELLLDQLGRVLRPAFHSVDL